MADSQVLGQGTIPIYADLEPLFGDLARIPDQIIRRAAEAKKRLQSELAGVQVKMGAAMEVGNANEVNRLTAAETQLKAKIDACNVSIGNQFAAMGRQTQAAGASAAATNQAAGAMGKVAPGSKNAAMGMLLLGQTIDDAQYGFRSIVNNIPGLVMSLGGSAGLAGALSIAAVAVNQFIQHWDDFESAFKGGDFLGDTLGKLGELRKELEKQYYAKIDVVFGSGEGDGAGVKSVRAAQDAEKERVKDESEAAGKAREKVKGLQSKEEKQRGQAVEEAIGESGQGSSLAGSLYDKAIARRGGKFKGEHAEEQDAALKKSIGLLLDSALKGKHQNVEALADLAGGDLGEKIRETLPAGKKAKKEKEFDEEADTVYRQLESRDRKLTEEGDEERFLEGNKEAAEARKRREHKAAEVAGGLESGASGRKFAAGTLDEGDVENALRAAGYTDPAKMGKRVSEVMDKLSEDYLKKVAKIAQERGVDGATAQRALAQEAVMHDLHDQIGVARRRVELAAAAPQASIESVDSYLKNIQLGAFNKGDDVPKRQLKVLESIEKALKDDRPAAAGAIFG